MQRQAAGQGLPTRTPGGIRNAAAGSTDDPSRCITAPMSGSVSVCEGATPIVVLRANEAPSTGEPPTLVNGDRGGGFRVHAQGGWSQGSRRLSTRRQRQGPRCRPYLVRLAPRTGSKLGTDRPKMGEAGNLRHTPLNVRSDKAPRITGPDNPPTVLCRVTGDVDVPGSPSSVPKPVSMLGRRGRRLGGDALTRGGGIPPLKSVLSAVASALSGRKAHRSTNRTLGRVPRGGSGCSRSSVSGSHPAAAWCIRPRCFVRTRPVAAATNPDQT